MRLSLPFLSHQNKLKSSFYLTLLLQDEKVVASLLEEHGGVLSLFSVAQSLLSIPLEKATYEELLNAADQAISQAEAELAQKIPNYKTIFGVHASWTEEGHILPEKLTLLKKMCEELSLTPIGFLVFTEAIVHLLHKKEGAPISAIIVELGKNSLRVSLVRAGRIVESASEPLNDDPPLLVDTILKSFTRSEILPSRIVLFDGEDNEKLSQSFLAHHWSKSLPFLHMPQVTILAHNFDLQGVLYGTATQLGLSMSAQEINNITMHTTIPQFEPGEEEPETTSTHPHASLVTQTLPDEEQTEPEHDEEREEITSQKTQEKLTPSEEKDVQYISDNIAPEYFGFSQDMPIISEAVPTTHVPHTQEDAEEYAHNLPEIAHQEFLEKEGPEEEEALMLHESAAGVLSFFNGMVKNITGMLPHFSLPKSTKTLPQSSSRGKFIVITGLILLVVIVCGSFYLYKNDLKGTITLIFTPQPLTQTIPVTFSQNDTNSILVSPVQTTNSVSGVLNTSGSKDIGNDAKGTVDIFSRASDEVHLAQGTQLTASNGLIFTLDSQTVVASFSGSPDDPSVVVNSVPVTAANLGPDYNIPAGTKFTIAGQSRTDMSAKNDNAFTGGTKSTITVVSADDMTNLTNQVLQKAKDQATPSLLSLAGSGKQILDASIQQTITDKSFSNKVGDQASSVSLTAKVQTSAYAYTQNDLQQFILQKLQTLHDPSTTVVDNSLKVAVGAVSSKNNVLSSVATISASLRPTVDETTLAQKLAGKSFTDAVTQLKSLPNLQDATVQLSPSLPFLPQILPAKPSNISFTLITQ